MPRTNLIVRSKIHIEEHFSKPIRPDTSQDASAELPAHEEPFFVALPLSEQTKEQEALINSEHGPALFEHFMKAGGGTAKLFEHFLTANVLNRPVFEHFLSADVKRRRVFEHFLIADPAKARLFEHFLSHPRLSSKAPAELGIRAEDPVTYTLSRPHTVSKVTITRYANGDLAITLED